MPVEAPPASRQAEWALVGAMLTRPKAAAEVIGQQLEPDDLYFPDTRLIFSQAVEHYYADMPVESVTVGEALREPLSRQWQCEPGEVASKLYGFVAAQTYADEGATAHANLIKALGDKRRLIVVMEAAKAKLAANEETPSEVGDFLASEAAKIATGRSTRSALEHWMDVGRNYFAYLKQLQAAYDQGIELGVYTGLEFFDRYYKAILPTEMAMVAGEPGVGKSAVCWVAGEGFARRQMVRPPEQRVATLILSCEMGLVPSSARLVTAMTGIDSGRLREGQVTPAEIQKAASTWAARRELPLYFNFASNFKLSQLRALIVEAIRKHNVGFVILDHFRQIDPDRRVNNANQEDELKARFLKESICKDLNVAMMVLAHTVKMRRDGGGDGRPSLADLRGSYQVAAYCDMVTFIYRPIMYADEDKILDENISDTDAEAIHAKNRNGELGAAPFHFDPAKMYVTDK